MELPLAPQQEVELQKMARIVGDDLQTVPREQVIAMLVGEGFDLELAEYFVDESKAEPAFGSIQAIQMQTAKYRSRTITGACLLLGGIAAMLLTYNSATRSGGYYVVPEGVIVSGAIAFFGNLGRWRDYSRRSSRYSQSSSKLPSGS
jgi:hypothetical protein